MKRITLTLLCLATATLASAAVDKAKLKAEVAGMEDAFCAMAKEKGLLAAFGHFAAPDVAFIDTDPRKWRGPAAVRERLGTDQPGVTLTWSALFTDVSDDGTLGYNWGRYESRRPGPDGRGGGARGLLPHDLEAPARRHVALRHGCRRARPTAHGQDQPCILNGKGLVAASENGP